jgi:hypothetical protein
MLERIMSLLIVMMRNQQAVFHVSFYQMLDMQKRDTAIWIQKDILMIMVMLFSEIFTIHMQDVLTLIRTHPLLRVIYIMAIIKYISIIQISLLQHMKN